MGIEDWREIIIELDILPNWGLNSKYDAIKGDNVVHHFVGHHIQSYNRQEYYRQLNRSIFYIFSLSG